MQWRPVTEHRFKLAEGPFWDGQEQALYWVDIAGRLACRLGAGQYRQWRFDEPVSSFIACVGGGALVTLASGVYRLDTASTEDSPRLELLCIPDKVPGNRANEARCDEHGRLWLGTMQNNLDADGGDLPITRRSGGLFRIDADGKVTQLLSDLGIANTLLWSAEGDCLLSADSLDGVIYRYAIKADGSLGECEIWAGVQVRGIPDGSVMDAQGYVWNARWDGHCLMRFAPDGSLDRIIELPVSHPTSCVFGGPELTTLFVTSAAPPGCSGELSGAVLMADVGVRGLPCHRFAG
ncbi:SMP-30/gluconolactonase/LRE family protein [Stutzerimonas nitrititolerans]|uniref:SMP-30/gluconolactonase/LRE family protein n=1 Tax=Stutzerimonas nitrititolerans TaxID=2482751 RepID=UPI0007189115|nr:SMP-30/gluconolactonase/LRE family protein [Stutzerimonas nitrititolerans]KRW69978.1 gluconolaconase [Pseudomonas sp. TTU2014-096BSC]WAD27567.1 SMP-30/gluconolactonase/LRE family protein [Pseudomonadaceae bacterium T75]